MTGTAPEADGLYVYALTPGDVRTDAPGAGIDGLPLRVIRSDRVAAIVHDHRGAPFAGSQEEARRRVLEHDAVVERLWTTDRAVLPMTFDVIVEADDEEPAGARLLRWMATAAEDLDERFRAIAGAVELRIDIGVDQRAAASSDPAVLEARQQCEAASPGVRRLLQKRLSRQERDIAERVAGELYPDIRAALARLSVELVENGRGAAAEGEVLLLSAAVLAREPTVHRIGELLAAFAAEHDAVRIRYLGPWPPYSFAALRPGASLPMAASG